MASWPQCHWRLCKCHTCLAWFTGVQLALGSQPWPQNTKKRDKQLSNSLKNQGIWKTYYCILITLYSHTSWARLYNDVTWASWCLKSPAFDCLFNSNSNSKKCLLPQVHWYHTKYNHISLRQWGMMKLSLLVPLWDVNRFINWDKWHTIYSSVLLPPEKKCCTAGTPTSYCI